MIQLENTWEITVNLLESLLLVYLLNHRLNFRKSLKSGILLGVLLRTLFLTVLNFIPANVQVTICLALLYNIAFSIYISDNKLFMKIAWGSCFSLICSIADKFTFGVASLLTNYPLEYLIIWGPIRMYMSSIYLLTCAVLVFFLTRFKKKEIFLPKRFQIILLLLIFLGTIATEQILSMIILVNTKNINPYLSHNLQIVGYLLLLLLAGFLGFIDYLGTVFLQNERLRRTALEFDLEKKHYDAMDTAISAFREWKHDYKNHLLIMLDTARQQNCDELVRYIMKLEDDLKQTTPLISTGNRILDAVLSAKIMELKKYKIQFSHEIYLTPVLPLDEVELTSLAGNLLDNAIEASLKLNESQKPYINFKMKPHDEMLYVSLENRSNGTYSYHSDGSFKSTKSGENHGFGIKKIQKIVAAKGGFCHIYHEADTFKTVIMLPITDTERNENE